MAQAGKPRITALRCEDLVDTTCKDPCDWANAFKVSHEPSPCPSMGYTELLVNEFGKEEIAPAASLMPCAAGQASTRPERIR